MLALILIGCAHRIPAPAELGEPPRPAPTGTVQVCWIETARGTLPRGLAVARGHLSENPPSTASGIVIRHATGSWLIDGGLAREVEAHIDETRGFTRFALSTSVAGFEERVSLPDALRAAGVEPATLIGAIPTHAHYDHLGGLLDVEVPIRAPATELAAVAADPHIALPSEAAGLLARGTPLPLPDGPVLYWPESADLFGDGSAVVVPLPGHTPGSLGVLLALESGARAFLVGDTVWLREGYERREPKSWLAGSFDSDADQNDLQIARLWALHQAWPELAIVPAHDRRQWEAAFGAPGCR